jgi:hypothetical protein
MQRAVCAGRVEFTEYFPENTQGVLIQPVGDEGVLVAATDTQRGFGRLDQVKNCEAHFVPGAHSTAVARVVGASWPASRRRFLSCLHGTYYMRMLQCGILAAQTVRRFGAAGVDSEHSGQD